MKFKSVLIGVSLVAASLVALAQAGGSAPPVDPATLTDGEVRKVDKENKKITIRHAEIKNLEMPGMTMVFQVSDPAMLDAVKPGDKVRFKAERTGGAIVVTDLRPAP